MNVSLLLYYNIYLLFIITELTPVISRCKIMLFCIAIISCVVIVFNGILQCVYVLLAMLIIVRKLV